MEHAGTWDRNRERSVFEGLDIDVRETPQGCGLCVATGAKMNEERVEDYQRELDYGLFHGLPMVLRGTQTIIVPGR